MYLEHLYGGGYSAMKNDYNSNGQFYAIDQTKSRTGKHDMLDHGFIYVPDKCVTGKCKLHVFFHGAAGSAAQHGSAHARGTGLLEHASAKGFVVIFPNNNAAYRMYQWYGGANTDAESD